MPVDTVGAREAGTAIAAVAAATYHRQQAGAAAVTAVAAEPIRIGGLGTVAAFTAPAQHQATATTVTAVAAVGTPSAVRAFTPDTPQGQKA